MLQVANIACVLLSCVSDDLCGVFEELCGVDPRHVWSEAEAAISVSTKGFSETELKASRFLSPVGLPVLTLMGTVPWARTGAVSARVQRR